MIKKRSLSDLAFFGGEPAFKEPLFVGRPNIGNRDQLTRRLNYILDSRWLTNNGPHVQEFERKISEITGARHCIAVCNATTGLEVAIRALELKGEVIVPAFTFVATAHSLNWMGLKPVFCDVDARTHLIDPARVEPLINNSTSAIMGVHLWGRVCEVEALNDIAEKHGLKLMFDAAHAFGCKLGDQHVGTFGELEIFSFHATKFINSFEGGAIVTNNDALAEKIRLMINFGFKDYDLVVSAGTNGKMSEISAAMGLISLESMGEFVDINRRNYEAYKAGLSDIPGVGLYDHDISGAHSNYQYVVIEIDEEKTGLSRDALLEILHKENVIARRYFYPGCHKMEPYKTIYPEFLTALANTDALANRVLILPTGTSINCDDIDTICEIIKYAIDYESRNKIGG